MAVKNCAAFEAAIAQCRMNTATGILLEVHAWVASRLVKSEIRRPNESESEAAQAHAISAVGNEVAGSIVR